MTTKTQETTHSTHGTHGTRHLMSDKLSIRIGLSLMVLTAITVGVAQIDLGHVNFFVAMLVASIKASLVTLFFMGMKHEDGQNRTIFASAFVFLFIFIGLTAIDLFYRGNFSVTGVTSNPTSDAILESSDIQSAPADHHP